MGGWGGLVMLRGHYKHGQGKAKDKHAAQPLAERGLTCYANELGGGHAACAAFKNATTAARSSKLLLKPQSPYSSSRIM